MVQIIKGRLCAQSGPTVTKLRGTWHGGRMTVWPVGDAGCQSDHDQ